MYYTYMLRCEDDSVYTGITTDPVRRFREHISRSKRAAGYTRSHRAERVIALWKSRDRSLASKLEYSIKSLDKQQKELIALSGSLNIFSGRLSTEDYTFVPVSEFFKDDMQ